MSAGLDVRELYMGLVTSFGLPTWRFAELVGITEETLQMRLGGALPITAEAMLSAERIALLAMTGEEEHRNSAEG